MVSKAQFEKIALSFDGVEKGTSYGKPAFLLCKKFFTRLRDEDASAVLFVGSIDEREMLIEVEPDIFHVTPHYKDYPMVLARLSKIDVKTLRGMLHRYWVHIAPKNLVKSSTLPAGAGSAIGKDGADSDSVIGCYPKNRTPSLSSTAGRRKTKKKA
jgi:hypothetical protein